MPLPQNPDEYFSKPLTVYPMTNPTHQTPEPPAAGEFTSNDIKPGPFSEHDLRMQWNAQADNFNQWDSLDSCEQLALAQTAAISADRARRPQDELVPVSERLPGPEDCDAEGRVWWLKERANPDHDLLMPTWHLQRHGPAGARFFRFTHWIPANALPLPSTTPARGCSHD